MGNKVVPGSILNLRDHLGTAGATAAPWVAVRGTEGCLPRCLPPDGAGWAAQAAGG